MEYLRNHDELEPPRDLFLSERAKLLDDLGAVMLEAAHTYGLFDVDIHAAYGVVRAKTGQSGTRQKKLELAALEKALGGTGVQVFGEGSWLDIRTAAQSAANRDLEALSEEVRRRPELFEKADPWNAKRWGG